MPTDVAGYAPTAGIGSDLRACRRQFRMPLRQDLRERTGCRRVTGHISRACRRLISPSTRAVSTLRLRSFARQLRAPLKSGLARQFAFTSYVNEALDAGAPLPQAARGSSVFPVRESA